jgi:plasmid stabilization system protein ParE
MYSLILLEDAKQEWLDSAFYYELKQKGLGERFSKAVEEHLESIVKTPKHYKKTKKEYREAVIKHFPFLVVFRIDEPENQIVVISIFHSKRHPKLKIKKE